MKRIQPRHVGLVFGSFLGLWHFLWAILVAAGAAQPLIDFIFNLHMITPPYKVAEFHAGTAAALVLVTTAIGFAWGFVGALLWNRCIPRDAPTS
jgi:hypothetical protein